MTLLTQRTPLPLEVQGEAGVENAVTIRHLTKRYPMTRGYRGLLKLRNRTYVQSLRDVSLDVPRGGIFGVLGPNGAGKTTLFKILGTLILPTSGEVHALGVNVAADPSRARKVLTYVISEERSLFWRLTGRQNLKYFAALHGLSHREGERRIRQLLALVGLEEAADRRVMLYSTGMRQRLALARGLLPEPEILLLDEPTRSMDPLVSRDLWAFVRDELVQRKGKTIILATHNLDEARRNCDRLAVLHRGEVRACGTVEDLSQMLAPSVRYSMTIMPPAAGVSALFSAMHGVHVVNGTNGAAANGHPYTLEMDLEDPESQMPLVLERAISSGVRVISCGPRERPLSDVLAHLTEEAAK